MTNKRFTNPWDATQTILGSVYGTPTYASGTESGEAVYTSPSTKYFSADQGAPARHVNWALQQIGESARQNALHQGMVFRVGTDWPSTHVYTVATARGNRAFLVGALNGVYVSEQESLASALQVYSSTAARMVLWDAGDHIWAVDDEINSTHRIDSTGVTNTNDATQTSLVGGSVNGVSWYLYTSGTATSAQSITGTTWSPGSSLVGTFESSTTSIWGSVQPILDSSSATGALLLFSRGTSTNQYVYSTDGFLLTPGTWPVSTSATKICDVAYDDVQSCFVLCTRPTAGGQCSFYTSPDGITWTLSSSASGPASSTYIAAVDGDTAFKILGGVWFMATVAQYSGAVFGSSGDSGKSVFGYYSLDFGVTWQKATMPPVLSTSGLVRITTSGDRFCVSTDKFIALSGRLANPEVKA